MDFAWPVRRGAFLIRGRYLNKIDAIILFTRTAAEFGVHICAWAGAGAGVDGSIWNR